MSSDKVNWDKALMKDPQLLFTSNGRQVGIREKSATCESLSCFVHFLVAVAVVTENIF